MNSLIFQSVKTFLILFTHTVPPFPLFSLFFFFSFLPLDGVNGQMPNLDLVNLVDLMARYSGVRVTFNGKVGQCIVHDYLCCPCILVCVWMPLDHLAGQCIVHMLL